MNLKYLHQYLGELLAAGVPPETHVCSLVAGYPNEVKGFVIATGAYNIDALPLLTTSRKAYGKVLVIVPVREHSGDLEAPEIEGREPWVVEQTPVACLPEPHEDYLNSLDHDGHDYKPD